MTKKTANHKRKLVGVVVSNVMPKTVVVKVTTRKLHPLYRKVVKNWKKYMEDTQGKEYAIGESVTIEESRKLSKVKRWVVLSK